LQGWGADVNRAPNERLGQVVRIDDREGPLQVRLIKIDLFDDRRTKTARNTIAANVAFLEVCRCHLEHVAFEFPRGESVPGMLRVLGRARATIEPDHSITRRLLISDTVGDELPRERILDFLDSERIQAERLIRRGSRPALEKG